MNNSLQILVVSDEVTLVNVSYSNSDSEAYSFKTTLKDLKKGDLIVVEDHKKAFGYTICRVTKVNVSPNFDLPYEFKWAVIKLDKKAIGDMLRQEEHIVERIVAVEGNKRRKDLRAELDAYAAEEMKALPIFGVHEEDKDVSGPDPAATEDDDDLYFKWAVG